MKLIPETRSFELRVTPTRTQVFAFSAITWNRHKIHFDREQALAEGLADVAVQRGLLGNFLARTVMDWAGASARLENLSWKVTRSAYPDRELRCQAEVTRVEEAAGGGRAHCALRILDADGGQIAIGEASVRFI